jgi:hypothetical protein
MNGRSAVSASLLLPLLALLVSATLVLIPTVRAYVFLERAAQQKEIITVESGSTRFAMPTDKALIFAIYEAALRTQGQITVLNAPGQFFHVLVSRIIAGNGNWYPTVIGPSTWRVLIFPFYALPAWFFVGRGLDGLFRRKRLRKAEMVMSLSLAVIFLTFSLGLRFGLSATEREGQLMLDWYIYGFALWGILIAIPFIAWLRQRGIAAEPLLA